MLPCLLAPNTHTFRSLQLFPSVIRESKYLSLELSVLQINFLNLPSSSNLPPQIPFCMPCTTANSCSMHDSQILVSPWTLVQNSSLCRNALSLPVTGLNPTYPSLYSKSEQISPTKKTSLIISSFSKKSYQHQLILSVCNVPSNFSMHCFMVFSIHNT